MKFCTFICIIIALTFLPSCSRENMNTNDNSTAMSDETPIPTESEELSIWVERANIAQRDLVSLYWDDNSKRMKTDSNNSFHYWWQAHVLDVLFDGYERSGNEAYANRAKELYKSIARENGGSYINDFYDDMEWLAIALLRGYKLTGDAEYKDTVNLLWTEIKSGWNSQMGGGIGWQKNTPYYKNTPANMPATILAVRLYSEFGNDDDLEWAKKIYDWQIDNLVSGTGLVWDGINRNQDGKTDKNWLFTYCQGVFIGASVELYQTTDDVHYLDLANLTAKRSMKYFSNSEGIIKSEGNGDGGLFRGIYIRYLTQLALVTDSETIKDYLLNNADVLWNESRNSYTGEFSADWGSQPKSKEDLSVQLSAIMLIESATRL